MKKYIVIENEHSKYYKDIPYITKKEFKNNSEGVIVGKTRLKKYKSDSEEELDLLCFNEEQYEVKDKIIAFKKGYVDVGDNKYVLLKKRIPFLILFLLFLALFLVVSFPKENVSEEKYPVNNTQEEVKIPTPNPSDDSLKSDIPSEKKENINRLPQINSSENSESIKYIISFDGNGGYGSMDSIICEENKVCNLSENKFIREGYTFKGWSIDKVGDNNLLDNALDLSSISEKTTLYAQWNVNSYNISFVDYDDSIIQEDKYDFSEQIVFPEVPKREGYTFIGWDNTSDIVISDLSIKALYDLNAYKINYNLNGGNLDDAPSKYNIEEEDLLLPYPKKIGYDFIGWTDHAEENPIKDYVIEKGSIGDLDFIANYVPKKFNLIYNTNGAKEILSPKEIEFDSKFGELPSVTKEGYDFVNWSNIDNKEVSSNTIYNEANDINIYANWKTINYDLIYNLVGGEIEDAPSSYNIETPTFTLPHPIKEGYIFIGWTTEDDSTIILDYDINEGTIGNKEFTANYRPISYYISYNSSNSSEVMENTRIKYNNRVNLSKNIFTREGYTFLGWSTEEEGEVIYSDEAEIYNLSSKDGEVIDLYAQWEIIKLNVKYIDLFDVILKEETVNYGNHPNYPADPFIDGYTFKGWNPTSDIVKQDTIYKANYSVNDYIITYDLNIGNSDDVVDIHYNVESETFTLPIPERIGYTFLGWTGSNGLKPEVEVTILKSSIGDRNYKANWEANIYDVSLNANGGSIATSNIKVAYNSLYGIIPEPTRIGYIFDGWYYNNDLIDESTVMQKDYNHEIKAKWTPINYRISYNLDGGNMSSQVTSYNIETATFTLSFPTKKGYTFIGWTGSNGSTPNKTVTIEKGSMGDKEYTANYTYDSYSISYNLDGGNANGLRYNYTIDDSFALPIPWKNGYDFLGWTGSNGSNVQRDVGINRGTTGNKSYTANWRKYNANDYNGIYMVSTRDNVTWSYNLNGFYNVGDTNVHSGNWMVTVSDYCVDIVGTKYPDNPYTYQFYIYKANSTSELLATGNASVLGNFQNNARARICW